MSVEQPIGTCSECGGPVVLPSMSVDPVPYCRRCGATKRQPYGPVIPMEPRKRRRSTPSPYDLVNPWSDPQRWRQV